jgi:hypothetical protein
MPEVRHVRGDDGVQLERWGRRMRRPSLTRTKQVQDALIGSSSLDAQGIAQQVTESASEGGDSAIKKSRKRAVRNFPASSFEEALSFAGSLFEFGSGQPARRLSLFNHLGKAPESGPSRQAITNASRYGLISGSHNSETLELTDEGRRILDDTTPAREKARLKTKLAIENIEPFQGIYEKFKGNRLPPKAALLDAAKEFRVADDALEEAVDTFVVNLRFVGLLQVLSGVERIVSIDHLLDSLPSAGPAHRASQAIGPSAPATPSDHASFDQTCFYITPIGEPGSEQRLHADLFLGSLIEPALEPFNLKVVRADAIEQPGVIGRQVIEYILRSRLVIVDLSYHNPNVFYELALRHVLRLPVVQITRVGDRVPFDINQMRTIVIDNTGLYAFVPQMNVYKAEIANQVRRALEDPDSVDNPISPYFPALRAHIGS